MPVRKDAAGNRSVEAQADVPGTPEEVWNAIATGPGISQWFVPSEVEGRTGGTTVSHFAADGSMDSAATITAWEPPKRFVAEAPGEPGTVATEWIVEAKSGGLCTVRVVHRWFATSDDWDDQFEAHSYGWISFFRLLRLYLTHFPGQHGSAFQLLVPSSKPLADAWRKLVEPLGLANATEQRRVASDAQAFEGIVERTGPQDHPELVVRLDQPAPGFAHLFALPMGGMTYLSVRFFLFGDDAASIAKREEPRWRTWLEKHFPTSAE
ncbi:MAG: SRPBCC domain-containing protein [Mesorhizobium sp.]|uniref:SRPBCC family protein n=1 Tax=Mesorhizobium sp. TaxID=1871066 RepID=UPI000FE7EE70|nr:SRPBCC domain-containing protein [Mesorhizobium sp.]RWH77292.1 MAG: SRPBCC domain-containing protein [Mesorhizobium sp.]RWH77503.1 MAG: SRPBCC domain-containing protein [Mesorhizobium sp.]RWH87893.1 MAG: SRPBCC domain-containing protein [Mesorhizobium sp.]RWH95933.1 MAG: SRPBCC domain-containing protein [Mesorhizobium sp.]RWH98188.1 MAG: SRPBCC domain-containing protein [Mesorhizobium sp.]